MELVEITHATENKKNYCLVLFLKQKYYKEMGYFMVTSEC